jgi:hypothetical protein
MTTNGETQSEADRAVKWLEDSTRNTATDQMTLRICGEAIRGRFAIERLCDVIEKLISLRSSK